jgi:hypothetical protein
VGLTRRQRNELFEVLSKKGIDPADCRLRASGRDVGIDHWRTNSDFLLKLEPDLHRVEWTVSDGPESGGVWPYGRVCANWEDVLEQLGYWAEEVQYVNDTPDFWAELKRTPEILTAARAADASNEPFTPDEQAEIGRRLDEVKQLVRDNFDLTDAQLAVIDQHVDEIKEESNHQGRKTWLYTFYGAVMSTFMTDEIPPHVIQTIVATVLTGIGHLFGIGGLPPIISS